MKARRFLHSDSAVAVGLGMEATGLLLAFGTVAPALGVGLVIASVLLLIAVLATGGEPR